MNGRVAVGGVKIDDSVSYCAAACWADVIDSEVHVGSLSLQANGGHSKGSAKIVKLRRRTAPCDGVSVELDIATLPCEFVETVSSYPQISTPSNSGAGRIRPRKIGHLIMAVETT